MVQTKVTFTLDEQTLRRLENASQRTLKTKSAVVREAIAEYHANIGKLSESERSRLLAAVDRIMDRPAVETSDEVDREIAAVRKARKSGGRKQRS
jgi:predicted DNA-binding protein